jgi:hypothetical protein
MKRFILAAIIIVPALAFGAVSFTRYVSTSGVLAGAAKEAVEAVVHAHILPAIDTVAGTDGGKSDACAIRAHIVLVWEPDPKDAKACVLSYGIDATVPGSFIPSQSAVEKAK